MDWELFYSSFRKPDFIPGFEIQNRLGGGAFGDVYKARKVSIDKPYAIKFLKIDEATSRAAIERELEQVRHFSAIDHPNLVTIEDMGVVLDVPYLVMGYAGEDTLARRLRRERLAPSAALSFFVQTCRGVAALHERRLAHFDLKPSNVFLKGDVARVGDYGLAKLLIDGRQTLSFGRGTPQYMAPEMLKNRADERADIYSLGVILYELFSGKLPFETTPEAGVVLRENDEPPPFPEEWPLRLKVAVSGCLRVDPARRFQTVPRLLEALGQSAGAGDPLVALESLAPWSGPPPGEEREATPAEARPGAREREVRHTELRNTASDLTRGAVEVARGVWEGLKNPRGARATPPPLPRLDTSAEPIPTPPVTPATALGGTPATALGGTPATALGGTPATALGGTPATTFGGTPATPAARPPTPVRGSPPTPPPTPVTAPLADRAAGPARSTAANAPARRDTPTPPPIPTAPPVPAAHDGPDGPAGGARLSPQSTSRSDAAAPSPAGAALATGAGAGLAAAGASRALGDDVLSIETLEEAARGAPPVPATPSGAGAWGGSSALGSPHELGSPGAPVSPGALVSPGARVSSGSSGGASVTWSGTPSAAVPVPPRAQGGFFAALRATLEVGVELFSALITGPVLCTVGGVGRAGGRFVRGGRGWFLASLRLALFLAGMLALGAGLMYLVFLSLQRT